MLAIAFVVGLALAAPPPAVDCPAPAVWSVTATNTLVCAGVPPVTPPDPGGGGTDPVTDECTSSALRINDGWGKEAIETSRYGTFKDNVLAIKVAPPVGWTGDAYASWVEYQAGPFNRVAIMTTIPCSFDKSKALKYSGGQPVFSGNSNRPAFRYRAGAAASGDAGLTPGNVYYLNIKNANPDGSPNCSVSNCSMRGGVPSN